MSASALRAATGGDLGATAALAGTSNVLPIAVLRLDAAVFARGWAPRATGALPVGGFLLQTIGQGIGAPPRSSTCHRSPTSHQSPWLR